MILLKFVQCTEIRSNIVEIKRDSCLEQFIEIALDGIENEELREPKKCYQYIKDTMKDEQKYYLLLDEVQFMPRFEEVLNSLLRISNIDVYVTGSNSKETLINSCISS